MHSGRLVAFAAISMLLCGCNTESGDSPAAGNPGGTSSSSGTPGDGGVTIESASDKFPDLDTLWSGAISRTCGPNNGVCHNSKQFPDMQTSSGLLQAIGIHCNQIRTDPSTIDNLCEAPGDVLQIGSFQAHIGLVTATPASAPTSISVTLDQALPASVSTSSAASIVRQMTGLPTMTLKMPSGSITSAMPGTKTITFDYALLNDATKAPAPPPASAMGTQVKGTVASFLVPPQYQPDDDTQVQLGDPNGDGTFGASLGGAVVKPGDPLNSYLFLRVLGPLSVGAGQTKTNTAAATSTEAQMPLANWRYWDAPNAIGALWCWISTMKSDASNADGPIDYSHCDLTKMPAFTPPPETASTYSSVFSTILQPSCEGPCHHAGTTQPTKLVFTDAQTTYDLLLGYHGDHPTESTTVPYITPGDPSHSFLYLKVSGDASAGARMPLGGQLPQSAVDAVGTWITQGANND